MKYKFLILLFSLSLFSCVIAQEKPKQLKVLSYNLRFGELASLEEFAEFIKNENLRSKLVFKRDSLRLKLKTQNPKK